MKNKIIIAAALSALILCSCGESTSGVADISQSNTVSRTEETEASETAEITEPPLSSEPKVTEPQILELTHDRETPKEVMPENTEFTVDLKDITHETDLFALTNMEKHSSGDTFKMDLDGDGTEEEITPVINRLPRKLEKCCMAQQFCRQAKPIFRRNTCCIARKIGKA